MNLEERRCKSCGCRAEQVIRMEPLKGDPTRIGWYCPACHNFIKAVGQERIVERVNNVGHTS